LLRHNEAAYRQFKLKKRYFSSVSSADFKHLPQQQLPLPGAAEIEKCRLFQQLDAESRASLLAYPEQGFAVIRGFLPATEADAINTEIETLFNSGKIHYRYRNKLTQLILRSENVRSKGLRPDLLELLGVLLQGEARLFHSINFFTGSEQHTHSDSIHMTTYPAGGMLGVWFALEDIDDDNGPLHYYPGSHKLPYYLNADYQNEGNRWFIGDKDYSVYEDFMAARIAELGLQKTVFHAKKGDILIWHANLFHGGNPQLDRTRTRKSMVFHYFRKGVVSYHEITQRPALIHRFGKK
jgi:ectoine hydroxylase-related dioxygenase (phytanoyl-CoA dioxygenase family)